jgi:hypothetical protein
MRARTETQKRADAEALLAVAKESPARVAVHDKAGWLALFAQQGIIEDPVGAAPHQRQRQAGGQDPLDAFYETFIAPNEISLASSLDVVAGNEVARDVVISTRLLHGAQAEVSAYLLYELVPEDGTLRIARLGAHWEVLGMSLRVMGKGLRGLLAVNAITLRMLRIEGLSGFIGYLRGFLGIGAQGTAALERFAEAVASRDAQSLATLFIEHDATVEWPIGEKLRPAELLERLPAGATWRFERPQNSGFVTACRFTLTSENPRQGIAFFHFDRHSRRIEKARFFVAESAGAT